MPYRIVRYDDTPNPNALKCILDRTVAPGPRSYRSADQAAADPVAAALFAIPGVTGLLFSEGWLTVSKAPETPWKSIKPGVERALAAAPE